MTKSYRLRTKPGVDQNIRININQDFDFLEILSLKLKQEDVYTRFCSDYGVVVGRVITNGGFGVPNANVSIFVPLSEIDENDPVISTLYPYKFLDQKNEDGYRYNLLPYVQEYNGHTPTGTFPSREDVLTRKEVLEIYEKYYKYTVKTNDSGDFMIVGVPLGSQKIVLDLDLSNMGCFSLRPSDLIRMNRGVAEQFDGQRFKSSEDLASLPQIVNAAKDIDVTPFWGQDDICNIGITRVDFDLRDYNIDIRPQATFMGSIFSTTDEDYLKTNCKPKKESGSLCDLVTSPGRILAIRQTKDYDSDGRPILEQYNLENGGNVIDENGTWIVEVPMNLDYVVTNEFGEQVLSNDPSIGVPTKGKYRFRIQYQNEDGLNNDVLRADYLVPNVKEWGWTGINPPVGSTEQLKSYAFSLDWNDYGDSSTANGLQMINEAINCEDRFYEFNYNKVYTIANFFDRWKWGYNRNRHLGIKEITDRSCSTTNNRFPVNDGVRNFDFVFFLFNLMVTIFTPVFLVLVPVLHVLAKLWPVVKFAIAIALPIYIGIVVFGWGLSAGASALTPWVAAVHILIAALTGAFLTWYLVKVAPFFLKFNFKGLTLPMISYPDCEACACEIPDLGVDEVETTGFGGSGTNLGIKIGGKYEINSRTSGSILSDTNSNLFWGGVVDNNICNVDDNDNQVLEGGYPTYFCYIDQSSYGGGYSKEIAKFQADGYGIRYGIAGYPTPPEIGMPVVTKFSNKKYIPNTDITYSQSLNLANLRVRYFDSITPNRIKTTINGTNPPIFDNVLILMVDPNTYSTIPAGTLLSFTNPNSVLDHNITGATNVNQFGTNSVTGTSFTSLTSTNITYIDPVTLNPQSVNVFISGNTTEKEYKFKTGIEYFQVVTGMTMYDADLMTSGIKISAHPDPATQYDTSSLLRKYILNKLQNITYEDNSNAGDGGNIRTELINPLTVNGGDSWQNQELIFLVRGVDPFSDKQNIEYDLSLLFGYGLGSGPKVSGDYYLNVPIQSNSGSGTWYNDKKTPEPHNLPYSTSKLYHRPFNFQVDGTQFSSVTSTSIRYYSSLDRSIPAGYAPNGGNTIGFYTGGGIINDNGNSNQKIRFYSSSYQGIVEGGALMASTQPTPTTINALSSYNGRIYSPAYHVTTGSLSFTIPSGANPKLVLRSDRLPTSDKTQSYGSMSMLLHQNDNFAIYSYGEGAGMSSFAMQLTDTSNNAKDFGGDVTGQTSNVLSTFDCEGMVPLKCYEIDTATNTFYALPYCGYNQDPTRVKSGCYLFIQKPYIKGILKDYENFAEWKARFRMMYGACQGVFSHVFQNNWINGSLYMFSFKKQTIFSKSGEPKKYKFCGTYESSYRPGQGPIFYTSGSTNSFFYRSTPYNGSQFVGQKPLEASYLNSQMTPVDFGGTNDKNILFPTTIMDLGPRDQFTKEICFNPQFEGYLVDTIRSTSYKDTSDILQLFIVSRLINTNFLSQIVGYGDASINSLFSRTEDRLDGDVVQMFSINSEYGVNGFSEDEYDGVNDIYISTSGPVTMGVFFSSTTANRQLLSPGKTSYTTFGYPKTQVVPMYKWESKTQNTIFGSDKNEWYTQGPFYKQPYQSMDFTQTDYFKPGNGEKLGYIYSRDSSLNVTTGWPNGQDIRYVVGAPYHFYFGLKKGQSAVNRYITKYIFNQ